MQINNLNYSTCNVNHKGFIKDYKALKRDVYITLIKSQYCQKKQQFTSDLMLADLKFHKFCDEKPLRTFFYNILKKMTFIPSNTSNSIDNNSRHEILLKEKEIVFKKENLKYIIDDKEYSFQDFYNLYKQETDLVKREELYNQYATKLNSFEKDIKALVSKRNEYAQKMGYKNYFDYELMLQYGISSKELDSIINEYVNSEEVKFALVKRRQILEREQGVNFSEMTPSQIRPITDFCNIDNYIKTPKNIVNLVKKIYQNMGFDIETLEKNNQIIYDLECYDGKSSEIFCQSFPDVDSVMIYANLHANARSFEAFLHEMGHAMYDLHVSKFLPNSLRYPKAVYNEAIAMMFEKLLLEKDTLADLIPKELLDKYQEYAKVEKIHDGLIILAEADFEREMYNNPNQDFVALKRKINKKYNLSPKNKIWFADHYVTNPARRPVYLKGLIIANKMYKALREYLGTELGSNPQVAEILMKNLFRYGKLMNDKRLNKNFNL